MKLPVAIAMLLGATTALPAFAASIVNTAPGDVPQVSVESVQYRQVPPRYRTYRPYAYGYRGAYGAYGAYNAYASPYGDAYTPAPDRPTAWGHCVDRTSRSNASAYPSWDVC